MGANAIKAAETRGRGFQSLRRKSRSIRTRLIGCFVVIVLLMIAAYSVAVWQFSQMAGVAERLRKIDETYLAFVRVHFDITSFRDRMDALAISHDTGQFEGEAAVLRNKFVEHVNYAQQMLRTTLEPGRNAPFFSALESLRVTLLSQLDTALQLASVGEWGPVRLRLATQIPPLIAFSSSLVDRVDAEVSAHRSEAIKEAERARQRLLIIGLLAGLLTLLAVAALGWYITHAITAPLSELTRSADALARSDFQNQVNLRGDDELALLGSAFNEAARQLQQLYDNLRRSEQEVRDVINAVPVYVWRASPDGTVDFINERLQKFVSVIPDNLSGWNWQFVLHSDDRDRFISKWRAALKDGLPMEEEVRVRGVEGQYRWFFVRNVPLRDEAGSVLKWYGSAVEIEDRKRAEQERDRLHQLEADLAHVNRVSTMGELAASIAHEIKQPIAAAITSIDSCLRWLAHSPPNLDRARAAATRGKADGNRAADIIDRLRSLYKKDTPERELVAANEVIREMVVLLRSEANRYAVSIPTDLIPDLPMVMADRVQLQQVLMNLMLNAIEAMKDTGGVLTIKSRLAREGAVMISVTDTGVGLPPDKADEIFSAFFTTKPQGSGMGLTISRSIVESHGGHLWVTANDGRGAAFHFTLPTAAEGIQVSATGSQFDVRKTTSQ